MIAGYCKKICKIFPVNAHCIKPWKHFKAQYLRTNFFQISHIYSIFRMPKCVMEKVIELIILFSRLMQSVFRSTKLFPSIKLLPILWAPKNSFAIKHKKAPNSACSWTSTSWHKWVNDLLITILMIALEKRRILCVKNVWVHFIGY